MKINVTQEDIDLGAPQSQYKCPIARAISRDMAGIPGTVVVRWGDVIVGGTQSIGLPVEAQDFIRAFDTRRAVKPFTFELAI